MGVGQCATHVVPVAPNALSRRTYPTGKLGRCGWWVVILFVEDGAVGWSCKCSSGRHCRRIGGHRSRDRARPSCSLCHRGYSQTARRRGQDTRVAALEFCVHGIVVHLRLGLSGALTGCMLNWMIAVLAIGGLQPATETLLTITWQLA